MRFSVLLEDKGFEVEIHDSLYIDTLPKLAVIKQFNAFPSVYQTAEIKPGNCLLFDRHQQMEQAVRLY